MLLVERGLAPTRARAQALLVAGKVFSGEVRVDKPGTTLPLEAPLEVRGDDNPFVSRGGLKLRGALASFAPLGLSVAGKIAVDVGASTGGFTDCLLTEGATRVYAVDVGHGLLHQRLRDDPRVVVRERENARTLTAASFPDRIDLAVVDASFIGIGALIDGIAAFLPDGAELCALVKPQFEVGREGVSRGGLVREEGLREEAVQGVIEAAAEAGFALRGRMESPVTGAKAGNVEYLVHLVAPERAILPGVQEKPK